MGFPVRRGLRGASRGRHRAFAATAGFVLSCLVLGACSPAAEVGSIGVVLGRHQHTGALHVRDAPAGLAGDRAGLRIGDRIKMIDGMLVDRLPPERIRELLRGPSGTSVTLTIVRGSEVVHVVVVRAPLGAKTAASAASAPARAK